MRLLELKNDPLGIGIGVADGALLNYKSLQEQNGSVDGFTLTNSQGRLMATKGTLSIQGFRILTEESEELFDMAGFSSPNNEYYNVIVRITYDANNDDASYRIMAQSASASLNQTQIQNRISGSYDYPLARFKKSAGSVTEFKSLLSTIKIRSVDESDLIDYQTIQVD